MIEDKELADLKAHVREIDRRLDLLEKGDYSNSPMAQLLVKEFREQQASNKLTNGQKIAIFAPSLTALTLAVFNFLTKAPA